MVDLLFCITESTLYYLHLTIPFNFEVILDLNKVFYSRKRYFKNFFFQLFVTDITENLYIHFLHLMHLGT